MSIISLGKGITRPPPSNRYATLPVEDTTPPDEGIEVDRDILVLGDGDFSFAEALVARRERGVGIDTRRAQPYFARRVIATEYKSEAEVLTNRATVNRIKNLTKKGVEFRFGVDATNIATTFKGRHFSRIQWNCPDLNEPFCDIDSGLSKTLRNFALSAASLQEEGDRLHVSLIAPKTGLGADFWQAMHYGITSMEETGYVLDAIKPSGSARYSIDLSERKISWEHNKTSGDRAICAAKDIEELIFRRVSDNQDRTTKFSIDFTDGFKKRFEWSPKSKRIVCVDEIYTRGAFYSGKRSRAISTDSE